MPKHRYLVAGDINVDLIFKGIQAPPAMGQELFVSDMDFCLGGSAANTACALGKLGASVGLWSQVAQDEFGALLLRFLHESGVHLGYIKQVPQKKSGISIGMTNHQDRAFLSYHGTNLDLDFRELPTEELMYHTFLHLSGFNWERNSGGYLDLLQRAKGIGIITSLDLGWTDFDRFRTVVLELLPWVDYFFPNEMEAMALTNAANLSEALHQLATYTSVPVITLGSKGAMAVWQGQDYFQPSFKVQSVDSVGAGDAFNAGFLWAVGQGFSLPEALKIACASGALTTTGPGGGAAAPTKEVLLKFIKGQEKDSEGSKVS